MVIEGDSALTTSDTTLSCNPSSVNLEAGSSYVHLDEYIKWNPSRVTAEVFPLVLDTRLLWLHDFTLTMLLKTSRPSWVPARAYLRVMRSRVDLEGAREIITRRGRAFLALVASPRDGATGSHLS